jgi:hypothetical protein
MPYDASRHQGVTVAPHLIEDVRDELAKHRRRHGWEPGMVWNARAGWDPVAKRGGRYEWPKEGSDAQAQDG